MSNKYDRLFTIHDVRATVREALRAADAEDLSLEGAIIATNEAIESVEAQGHAMTFPADEPLFLLRGQDKAAKGAINVYLDECEAIDCGHAHIEAVDTAKFDLVVWQENHPDRMKVPD
jgi:hypothetical protein